MSTVHFLNVNPGDCSIIEHNSGRTSVIDICCGNKDELTKRIRDLTGANYRRADYPTNPVEYLKRSGVKSVFRFISTHPDMDHLDGFSALLQKVSLVNFWDSGVRRDKPPFGSGSPYKEEDWDAFVSARDNKVGVSSVVRQAGDVFPYANKKVEEGDLIDGLHILAPDAGLVKRAMETGDMNDASYVVLYRSAGGRILFTGDAHDDTFEYVLKHHQNDVKNCSVMIAPHHGRHSDREHSFLDVVKPGITLFGYAPSEHLAYNAYSSRNLEVLTSNSAGDIVLECSEGTITVYVENIHCDGVDVKTKNAQGYYLYGSISRP